MNTNQTSMSENSPIRADGPYRIVTSIGSRPGDRQMLRVSSSQRIVTQPGREAPIRPQLQLPVKSQPVEEIEQEEG